MLLNPIVGAAPCRPYYNSGYVNTGEIINKNVPHTYKPRFATRAGQASPYRVANGFVGACLSGPYRGQNKYKENVNRDSSPYKHNRERKNGLDQLAPTGWRMIL